MQSKLSGFLGLRPQTPTSLSYHIMYCSSEFTQNVKIFAQPNTEKYLITFVKSKALEIFRVFLVFRVMRILNV